MAVSPFTQKVIDLIRAIPEGRVATFAVIAAMAGNRRAARQVTRILHSSTQSANLPWHRVINREGKIALGKLQGYEQQKRLLQAEGVEFGPDERIDLDRFQWLP